MTLTLSIAVLSIDKSVTQYRQIKLHHHHHLVSSCRTYLTLGMLTVVMLELYPTVSFQNWLG